MAQVRHIHIKNFRTIKELVWCPNPGLNCLIGYGDSGKSTLLDAIDLVLGARRSYPFTDADFFELNTSDPIEISITTGALEDQIKNIETYGMFLRGFDASHQIIIDEPKAGLETVITIKLIVDRDLEPDWQLFSERACTDGIEKRLLWKHRELFTPARLGVTTNHHLSWGARSVLNKLSEESIDVSSTLTNLSRAARESFSKENIEGMDEILSKVKTIANKLGVSTGDLRALLDVNSINMSQGAISLHNNDNTPLRQLGTGSARLLISGLQKSANNSNILIIDEAEYGLEPYRITRLLNELGSKNKTPNKQVFISTHSPYVLRELQSTQLHVLRKQSNAARAFGPSTHSHLIFNLSDNAEHQATLRSCAETFFSRFIVVCEGKTEIGLLKGIDLYFQDNDQPSLYSLGLGLADGNGDTLFTRAKIFNSLGYPTAILKDSDIAGDEKINEVEKLGIKVFKWEGEFSTEGAIFNSSPSIIIKDIISIAIGRKGPDSINANIKAFSQDRFDNQVGSQEITQEVRNILALVSNKKSWFKDINTSERLSRYIIMPNFSEFASPYKKPIHKLLDWILIIGVHQ